MPAPKCKHCGDSVERAPTTADTTATSDACYGCRNRYTATAHYVAQAISYLERAQALQEEEGGAPDLADHIARESQGLPTLLHHVMESQ